MTRQERFGRQAALQHEADAAAADLALDELLGALGTPVRVGSSALGLMVWRDLDVTVVCPTLNAGAVAALVPRLASHPRVREVSFRNDTGVWNREPELYPDGLYVGLRYRSKAGHDWKADIWFVDAPDRQPDLAHLRTIAPRLHDEARDAILTIKERWHRKPDYGRIVFSYDIYMAVLDKGVRTPEAFERWLEERTGGTNI